MEAAGLPLTMFSWFRVGRIRSMGSLPIEGRERFSMSTKLLEDERALVTGCAGGWKGLREGALAKLGTISLFVHAASPRRLEADTPLSVSEATWDAMTDINLRSGFFLAREVGRQMRDNRIKGRILLITSQHREMPRNLPHYSASKAGMTMVMKELARVLAPDGIRVNAIAPGAIPGGFVADNLGELVAQIP